VLSGLKSEPGAITARILRAHGFDQLSERLCCVHVRFAFIGLFTDNAGRRPAAIRPLDPIWSRHGAEIAAPVAAHPREIMAVSGSLEMAGAVVMPWLPWEKNKECRSLLYGEAATQTLDRPGIRRAIARPKGAILSADEMKCCSSRFSIFCPHSITGSRLTTIGLPSVGPLIWLLADLAFRVLAVQHP
jgi:hypothetical protein